MITKRLYLLITIVIGHHLLFAQTYSSFIKVKKNAPNVLWICTDQQRWNTIGALGYQYVHTPNIDKLVKGGVSFLNAFCQAPACTPSRASFMTGMYASTVLDDKLGKKNGRNRRL